MRYLRTLITWVLFLGVFSHTAFADVCFCGEACQQCLRANPEIKVNLPFHMQCSDIPCKNCKLEQFRKVMEVNSAKKALRITRIANVIIINRPPGHSSTHPILSNRDSFQTAGAIPLSPIYLLNRSVLL